MKNNALFIQRFAAFIIDIMIVSLIASFISTPFINASNSEKLTKQSSELVEKVMAGEIDQKTYIKEASVITYKIDKNNALYTIINIIFGFVYFVIFQFYKKGQTIGKQIFKIKVDSNDGVLNINQMIARGLLIDMILFDLIRFAFCMFGSSKSYFLGYSSVMMVEIIVLSLCGFMVMFKKDRRGLHDVLCNTKVVNVK